MNEALHDLLSRRFPEMRLLSGQPPVFSWRGTGIDLCGARDHDAKTGTYVKTLALCFAWIPIIPLGAYRVAKSEVGGLYLLGKVPLSHFAKTWNTVLVCSALYFGAGSLWSALERDAALTQAERLREAAELRVEGRGFEALQIYADLIGGNAPPEILAEAEPALAATFREILGTGRDAPVAAAFSTLAALPGDAADVVPDFFGLAVAFAREARAPGDGVRLLDSVAGEARFKDQIDALAAARRDLLEAWVVAEPGVPGPAVELAAALEAETAGEADCGRLRALLEPHEAQLGSTEGARILGQIYLAEGDYDRACPLIGAYLESRLADLGEAEQAHEIACRDAESRLRGEIESGAAGNAFYIRYEAAPKAQKALLASEYVGAGKARDPAVQRALARLERVNLAVPVALDFSMAQLYRAKSEPDPAKRVALLKDVEKTLLAIKGQAGDSQRYQLHLAQVLYWLGKPAEGEAMIKALLDEGGRSPDLLVDVALVMRELGEREEARCLSEEAYRGANSKERRYEAALARAYAHLHAADEVEWMRKCDPGSISIATKLEHSLGSKAVAEMKYGDAEQHLRKAIEYYEQQGQSIPEISDSGVAFSELFYVLGDYGLLEEAASRLREAVRLSPENSISLLNASGTLWFGAVAREIEATARLANMTPAFWAVDTRILYNSQSEFEAYLARLSHNPRAAEARDYAERAMVLAPKMSSFYGFAADLYPRDVEALRAISERIDAAQLKPEEVDLARRFGNVADGQRRAAAEKRAEFLGGQVVRAQEAGDAGAEAMLHVALAAECVKVAIHSPAEDRGPWLQATVENARNAFAARPSSLTRQSLADALAARAAEDLAEADRGFGVGWDRARRAVAPIEMLALALQDGGTALALAIKSNPHAVECARLIREEVQQLPDLATPQQWAVVRAFDPGGVGELAGEKAKANEAARLRNEIQRKLDPSDGSAITAAYLDLRLRGESRKATTLYGEAAARGIPLPEFGEREHGAAAGLTEAAK